ncbi:PAAR domain-containing protein [Paenibacillus elgii]|uniref:PAAR domain-containing protein n=1 Tax=Paenibacillus elgii TaxID=189691 RepID=UPI00203A566C|nr:PAAR domain-containing protein [Paenibacillus elgii]MCM3274155.1 PAAR domain-containing protein [Paenibacillus elgii]
MAQVALVGSTISGTTGGQHCRQTYYYSCNCGPFGCSTCTGYNYSSATISGSVSSGATRVFVNGVQVAINGSRTNENATCPSGYDNIGGSSGSGSVTASRNVYINGTAIACNGDNVTHFQGTGSITSGASNVMIG